MRNLLFGLILMILALDMPVSANLVMFEAGNAVICIDDELEKKELGDTINFYPSIYFDPVTREHAKKNEYTLSINEITITSPEHLGVVSIPIRVMISNMPFDLGIFTFSPTPVKNVVVGKLGRINTTLYNGSLEDQTPYLVTFTDGNLSCCIYDQDGTQKDMEDFLKRIDIISKEELPSKLPLLWTEE